jgi:hypothetical protein
MFTHDLELPIDVQCSFSENTVEFGCGPCHWSMLSVRRIPIVSTGKFARILFYFGISEFDIPTPSAPAAASAIINTRLNGC